MTMQSNDNSSGQVIVTAVATPVPETNTALDIESQQKNHQPQGVAYANNIDDDDAGKNMGRAMFIVLVIGFIFSFFPFIFPNISFAYVSFVCDIVAIVIASILTCGCCHANDYNLKPNVKRFATATLVSLSLMFIVLIILLIIGVAAAISSISSDTGTISHGATAGLVAFGALGIVLNIMAIIFSALFTWGRGCALPW